MLAYSYIVSNNSRSAVVDGIQSTERKNEKEKKLKLKCARAIDSMLPARTCTKKNIVIQFLFFSFFALLCRQVINFKSERLVCSRPIAPVPFRHVFAFVAHGVPLTVTL